MQLQIVDGATYARRAAEVGAVEIPIPAARGLIFDREGRPLAINVPSWTVKARPGRPARQNGPGSCSARWRA